MTAVTVKEAETALDNLDDYAKMAVGIDPIGARETLAKFIKQYQDLEDLLMEKSERDG